MTLIVVAVTVGTVLSYEWEQFYLSFVIDKTASL